MGDLQLDPLIQRAEVPVLEAILLVNQGNEHVRVVGSANCCVDIRKQEGLLATRGF